jgi:hypothetical protein
MGPLLLIRRKQDNVMVYSNTDYKHYLLSCVNYHIYILWIISIQGRSHSSSVVLLGGGTIYKVGGPGFNPQYHWIFQLMQSFQPHCGLGVDTASNRTEFQKPSGWVGQPAHEAGNLTAVCEPIRIKNSNLVLH